MRHYEHFIVDGEILLPDKRSLKAGYGLSCPEAYDQNDPRFLEEVKVDMGNLPPRRGYIISPPSPGIDTLLYGKIGSGVSVVEVENPSGTFSEMGVHESKMWRQVSKQRTEKINSELPILVELIPHAFISQEESCQNVDSLSARVESLKAKMKS